MPSLRLLLPASALLVLALCCSVDAKPTESTPLRGVVTNYITPMANLSLEKLVGRWYMAEFKPFNVSWLTPDMPQDLPARLCLSVDFHYDDNGTLVAQPIALIDGERSSPFYEFPVSENGVWDSIYYGVSGEVVGDTHSQAVVYVDQRFLAVATCNNTNVKDCEAYTLVRHVADADSQSELADLRRRLVSAGVDNVDQLVKIIEPCRSIATAVPDLSAQVGLSTPSTE